MSDEILFLAHRLPFPPDRGDRIRSTHILRALADIAPVHVGCFVDCDADLVHVAELARIAKSHCVLHRGKPLPLAGVEALLQRQPVSLTAFAAAGLSDWVARLLETGRIGAVYVFSGQMGQFVPADCNARLIVDLVDVDSAKFEAYADTATFPQSWIHGREGRLLRGVEAKLAERADHTLLVSDAEAALLRRRAPDARSVLALGNGIDGAHFAPDADIRSPFVGTGPHLVFTGQMDYAPNVVAARRMASSILPAIRAPHPDAQFHVVGRAPTAEVEALGELPRCQIHGEVPDIRPYLAHATLVVAPLTIARGVQNKVLEAMAMGRPVLVSEEAATGIGAVAGRDLRIAQDDAAFVAEALHLLADPAEAEAMGCAARNFVLAHRSWPAMLNDLPSIIGLSGSSGDHRDAA